MNLTDSPQSLLKDVEKQLLSIYEFEEGYRVSLLKYSENIIYKITFPTMQPVVFRIHRPDYHNFEELEGEMIWMNEISKETDLKLPTVFAGKNGDLLNKMTVSSGAEVYVSVISFLYGKEIGKLSGEELKINMEKIGEITAKLHLQSINRNKSVVIKRFSWDIENLFGTHGCGIWGSWRDYPALSANDYKVLEKCEMLMVRKLEEYSRDNSRYGLIHGDLHFFNIINNHGENQIFDFDDCGYGFYMYDIGCSLVTYSKDIDELTQCWKKGYERVRKLREDDKMLLPMFVLLRRIVRLAWLTTHADSDTAQTVNDDYLEITVDMAKNWLKTNL